MSAAGDLNDPHSTQVDCETPTNLLFVLWYQGLIRKINGIFTCGNDALPRNGWLCHQLLLRPPSFPRVLLEFLMSSFSQFGCIFHHVALGSPKIRFNNNLIID